jgi:hypothetical protein
MLLVFPLSARQIVGTDIFRAAEGPAPRAPRTRAAAVDLLGLDLLPCKKRELVDSFGGRREALTERA